MVYVEVGGSNPYSYNTECDAFHQMQIIADLPLVDLAPIKLNASMAEKYSYQASL